MTDLHGLPRRMAHKVAGWRWRTGLLALLLVLLAAGWALAKSTPLFLRVRSAPIRSKPSLSEGDQKATVYLGQSFDVREQSKDGDWVKVEFVPKVPGEVIKEGAQKDPVEGWVHATVLTEKPLPLEQSKDNAWVKDGAAGLPAEGKLDLAETHARRRRFEWVPGTSAERQYPNAQDVEEFLKAGRLGLYRADWPSLEGGAVK